MRSPLKLCFVSPTPNDSYFGVLRIFLFVCGGRGGYGLPSAVAVPLLFSPRNNENKRQGVGEGEGRMAGNRAANKRNYVVSSYFAPHQSIR